MVCASSGECRYDISVLQNLKKSLTEPIQKMIDAAMGDVAPSILFVKKEHSFMMSGFIQRSLAVVMTWSLFGLSGCTIKATTDTTLDGTTNFLSSTTGKTWWTEDGLVREGLQVRAFFAENYESLIPEMARGEGEYVTAFVTLLGAGPAERTHLCRLIQANFSELTGSLNAHDNAEFERLVLHIQSLRRNGKLNPWGGGVS
jgi:hypothetical protein